MPKPGASTSRSRRSVSPGRPGSRAWKGASIGAVSGTSCAWPSVRAMTPARRARGTSASARSSAENRRVPWLPASATSTVRSSSSGRRPARASIACRAASICAARSPMRALSLRSTSSSAMSGRVSRVSSTKRGLARASSSSANTPARSPAPRARRQKAGTSAIAAKAPRATSSQSGRTGAKSMPATTRFMPAVSARCATGPAARSARARNCSAAHPQRASRRARAAPKPAKQAPAAAVTPRSARR